MKSLKSQLIEFAKRQYPKFLNGGEFERFAMDNGFKASNASRRARELCKAGVFDRRMGERGSVEYQYLPKRWDQMPPASAPTLFKVETNPGIWTR